MRPMPFPGLASFRTQSCPKFLAEIQPRSFVCDELDWKDFEARARVVLTISGTFLNDNSSWETRNDDRLKIQLFAKKFHS